MKKKTYSGRIELKENSDETGQFRAVFSTLNAADRDGDVTISGAFKDGQEVRIASWGHKWNELPVGRGVIHADDEKAWVDGAFFMDTFAGSETYKTVKNLTGLQEWSYGYDILKNSFGKFGDKDVQFLEELDVFEVSPVLLGAGIGTQTTAIKGAGGNSSDGAGDDVDKDGDQTGNGESSGPTPQVVLAQIDIDLMEAFDE